VARTVEAPDGRTWTIRRRWLHRPDWEAPELGGVDVFDGAALSLDLIDGLGALLIAIAAAVLLFALLVLALPVILFVAGLVVALAGAAARIAAIRPWTIEARTGDRRLEWQVRGWRRSTHVLEEVAAALALGQTDVQPEDAVYRGRGV
jgi:hypothetical protein